MEIEIIATINDFNNISWFKAVFLCKYYSNCADIVPVLSPSAWKNYMQDIDIWVQFDFWLVGLQIGKKLYLHVNRKVSNTCLWVNPCICVHTLVWVFCTKY